MKGFFLFVCFAIKRFSQQPHNPTYGHLLWGRRCAEEGVTSINLMAHCLGSNPGSDPCRPCDLRQVALSPHGYVRVELAKC